MIPNTENKEIQQKNSDKENENPIAKIELNDNDDESLFGETIKMEDIQPITSVKFFPSKEQIIKQRLRIKAISKMK